MKNNTTKKVITWVALAGVISAWLIGDWRYETENIERIRKILPVQFTIQQLSEEIYKTTSENQQTLFISIGQANGYEGPIKCAVISDSSGNIIDLKIIEQTETPSYFSKITQSNYKDHLLNQSVPLIVQARNEPDAISGATYTSKAITNSVYKASIAFAKQVMKIPIPERKNDVFYFRFLDILIILFLITVIISRKYKPKLKTRVRYILLIVSVITLGFTYNFHLTISRFNTLILGYWPDIYQHFSWYLLVFGVLLLVIISGKNPYCHWFCPFGAIQEGIGKITKSKITVPIKYNRLLLWIPRILAWIAIILALLYRNPGITSYEVFGKFFTLTGSDILFAMTLLSLIFSLFIRLPWCNYLCPVPPVIDCVIYVRKLSNRIWQAKNQT